MVTIPASALQALVSDIFAAAGCSKPEADRIGHSLVGANLTGHDSHGVVRVPRYLQWKREGDFIADQKLKVIKETPVMAVVDAQYGFGQSMAPLAVEIGIRKAKAMGLAMIAMRNSGHVGRVGEWAEMAAAAGLVSIHYVNAAASLLVAPFGGVDKRFSTAPYACGIPRKGMDPIILDFATSLVAEGKVMVASQGGKKLPADALIGPDGKTSGDPHLLYGDYDPQGPRNYKTGKGAIRAFGDHKGSGLAFMCEVLGGSLTGTGAADEKRAKWANGMLSFYVDPSQLDATDFVPTDIARYVGYVKSSRPVEKGGEVLIPGEPELRTRKTRLADGVPLSEDTWGAIVSAAKAVGVSEARIKQAGAVQGD
jgi:hydroxycarboxylate dehydrogenase B